MDIIEAIRKNDARRLAEGGMTRVQVWDDFVAFLESYRKTTEDYLKKRTNRVTIFTLQFDADKPLLFVSEDEIIFYSNIPWFENGFGYTELEEAFETLFPVQNEEGKQVATLTHRGGHKRVSFVYEVTSN